MYLFFKPLEFSISDADDAVQFIDLGLSSLLGFVYLAAIRESFGQDGLSGISPLLDLGWVHFMF
jgi:hypothetical protein